MVTKNISHTVTRAGRTLQHDQISIPVASDLITAPGVVKKENDVSFYSRNYPLESQTIEKKPNVIYNKIGNTTYGSDGSVQTEIGNHVFDNEGNSSVQIGDHTFNSDGSSSTTIGNTTFYSDGSTKTTIGDHIFETKP